MNEIISYQEMCYREGLSLQRGMNYKVRGNNSIFLMSVRPNAPYRDKFEDDGVTIIYEGHDVPKSKLNAKPKEIDQEEYSVTGNLTENGKFYQAALDYKKKLREAELIKVYEKIKPGIWSFNGVFELIDAWKEKVENRFVFKFKIVATDVELLGNGKSEKVITRLIPTDVKREVWKRDGGKCVMCQANDNLHFDHIIPYSKGGASDTKDNIQLLCGRHNIQKSNKIQ